MTLPVPRSDALAITDAAEDLVRRNLKTGIDPVTKTRYSYVCPCLKDYPWQWFWDSCFHAITLSHIDPSLAKAELRTLLSAQHPDGFIPHVIHWGRRIITNVLTYAESKLSFSPKSTALVQPPVLAQAVLRVVEQAQDHAFLAEVIEPVKRYYLWFRDNRDPDADGLVSVISPYETGMDQLPAYDSALGARSPTALGIHIRDRLMDLHNLVLGRNYNLDVIFRRDRFNVEDVMFNCVYAQGLRDTARMCVMDGDQPSADAFNRLAERTEQAVLTKCHDPETGAFWGLAGKGERRLEVRTVASLFPIILESIERPVLDRLVQEQLLSEEQFWLPYPLPSVSRSEPTFRPAEKFAIWRGPTWINMNWFLAKGLARHGYYGPARDLVHRSAEMVLKSGFREFYNPFTGEGYGAKDFGWSTLIVDML